MRTEGTMLLADGTIDFELYDDEAPATVAAFIEAIRDGIWAGGAFVRAVRADNDNGSPQIDVVQAKAAREASDRIVHESTADTGLKHLSGTLSLPRYEPGSGTAEGFSVCMRDSPELDAGSSRNPDLQGFAVFGRVTRGLELLTSVHAAECSEGGEDSYTAGQSIREPVQIIDIVIR